MENKPFKRPTIISVIGILNIVFASMGLISTVCCAGPAVFAGQFASQIPMPQGPGKAPIENPMGAINAIPGYLAIQCAGLAMGLVTGTLLLVSGIGFMKLKRWARTVGLTYAVIAIIWGVTAWILQQKFINPGMVEMNRKMQETAGQGANPAMAMNGAIMTIATTLGLLASFAFPITLLVLLMLPAVKLGLAGKIDPAWQPDSESFGEGIEPDETMRQ